MSEQTQALSATRPNEWFTPKRFAVFLALLVVVAFPQVIFGGSAFFLRDFGMFGYPIAHHHREAFWRGEIPLLNPLNDFGLPFLAQWNTMTLYPGALIYLLFPLSWSLGIFCLAHLYLGGLGAFFLARRWTGSSLGAAVAGVGFAFNGLSLSCLIWPNNSAALGWLPWVVLATERAWTAGRAYIPAAALAGAMQMLTGAPEIILQTWLLVGALWLAEFLPGRLPRGRLLARFAPVPGLVTGLCAVQLLPFLDLLAHSHRDSGFGGTGWSMPATGWANLIVPFFYAFAAGCGVYMQYQQQWISSYYPGVGLLALAILACWQVRSRRVYWLGAMLLLGLVLALGDNGFLYPWLRSVFPSLGFIRFPIKFVVLALAVMPFLAAHAVAFFEGNCVGMTSPAWRRALAVGLALAALIVVAVWFARRYPEYALTAGEWTDLWRNGAARIGFLTLIIGALILAGRTARPQTRLLVQVSLPFLLWLDVWTHAPSQNPSIHRSAYDTPLVRLEPRSSGARAMVSPFAVKTMLFTGPTNAMEEYLWHRMGMMANCNLLEGIPKVDGFYSLYLRDERPVRLALYPPNDSYPEALADFTGVAFVTAPGRIVEWIARTNHLPLASAGQQPIFADGPTTLSALVDARFDARRVVYLPLETRAQVTATNQTRASVVTKQWSAHRVALEAQAEEPSLVVLSQAFYHPWKARLGDTPTPILRANHGFQAVQVPRGFSSVTLTYEDGHFRLGAGVSLVMLAGVTGGWWVLRRDRS